MPEDEDPGMSVAEDAFPSQSTEPSYFADPDDDELFGDSRVVETEISINPKGDMCVVMESGVSGSSPMFCAVVHEDDVWSFFKSVAWALKMLDKTYVAYQSSQAEHPEVGPSVPHGTPLEVSTDSGVHGRRRDLITNPTRWAEVWGEHKPGTTAPAVEFDEHYVIAIFAGTSTFDTAGLRLDGVYISKKFFVDEWYLSVHYTEETGPPSPAPALIFKIPKSVEAVVGGSLVTKIEYDVDRRSVWEAILDGMLLATMGVGKEIYTPQPTQAFQDEVDSLADLLAEGYLARLGEGIQGGGWSLAQAYWAESERQKEQALECLGNLFARVQAENENVTYASGTVIAGLSVVKLGCDLFFIGANIFGGPAGKVISTIYSWGTDMAGDAQAKEASIKAALPKTGGVISTSEKTPPSVAVVLKSGKMVKDLRNAAAEPSSLMNPIHTSTGRFATMWRETVARAAVAKKLAAEAGEVAVDGDFFDGKKQAGTLTKYFRGLKADVYAYAAVQLKKSAETEADVAKIMRDLEKGVDKSDDLAKIGLRDASGKMKKVPFFDIASAVIDIYDKTNDFQKTFGNAMGDEPLLGTDKPLQDAAAWAIREFG
jgi:hypothetical protein